MSSDDVYSPSEIGEVLDMVLPHMEIAHGKKGDYYDVPAAFDIETTSFYDGEGSKAATMYAWMFGIFGTVVVGRTWAEFTSMLERIADVLDLGNVRLPVYVHNLAFEFQFFRKMFEWKDVFSLDVRKPIKALTGSGFEFRCSLALSGYALAKVGELVSDEYGVSKMCGDLDYRKMRHNDTPLTAEELGYCVNDVRVVMAYIARKIGEDGDVTRIPMTKTGYVRRECRAGCLRPDGGRDGYARRDFLAQIRPLVMDPNEYLQSKRAFQGGFTHANAFYSGQVVEDVTSYDFTSSYPTVMIAEKYPMGAAERVEITSMDELETTLSLYCAMFDVEVEGVELKRWQESPLSLSRCWNVENATVNNGRIVCADRLKTTMTEQDFLVFRSFYEWEKLKIGNVRRYKKGYLPTGFVKTILDMYRLKTELKGVTGRESEYLNSKEKLNSCYGMCVTDIVRPEYPYLDDWEDPIEPDLAEKIKKYNEDKNRFLFYPWGVWVTAYARRNLFTGILEFGDDYIYSDTDSIKARNAEEHAAYIERYNETIREQLEKALGFHGLPLDSIAPKTIDGVKKPLGVWDFDGHYSRFKTLGAKRYLAQYSDDPRNGRKAGEILLTVSGLNKKRVVPWMLETAGDVFDMFESDMYVPRSHTGKLAHTYIDEYTSGTITDYLGNTREWSELSSVHLEESDYSLEISREYADYIAGVHYMGE